MKFELDMNGKRIRDLATLNSYKDNNEYNFKFVCKDNPSCLLANLVCNHTENSDFILNITVVDEMGKIVNKSAFIGKYNNMIGINVSGGSDKNLELKMIVTQSNNINDWELVELNTYLENNASKLKDLENQIEILRSKSNNKIVVMCDSNGDIAEFYGKEIEENMFVIEGIDELVNSMTQDQKTQTYLRKLNGKLQTWWIN